jgi:hypothetical protein
MDGREREIPIRTLEQRQRLDEAKALAKGKSLVAPGFITYRDYLQPLRFGYARKRQGAGDDANPLMCWYAV